MIVLIDLKKLLAAPIDFIVFKIDQAAGLSDEELESIRYYIKSRAFDLSKTALLLALALILDMLLPVAIFMAVYGLLRKFSYGMHMPNWVTCFAVGLVYFLGGPYLALQTTVSLKWFLFSYCMIFILFLLFAPAETDQQFFSRKDRKVNKIISLVILSLEYSIAFLLSDWLDNPLPRNLVVYASAAQAINILPIFKFIFRRKKS